MTNIDFFNWNKVLRHYASSAGEVAIYLKSLPTEKLSKSEITREKKVVGGKKVQNKGGGENTLTLLNSDYSINLKQMFSVERNHSRRNHRLCKNYSVKRTSPWKS